MIPKKLKYTMTITLLALGTACLATGCKKKHDKIDLSGNQAAESSVQTAPAATTVSGEGNSEKMLQDIINSTTQVTEGLAQGMGIDVKALLSSIVGAKIASNTPEDPQKSDSDEYEQ